MDTRRGNSRLQHKKEIADESHPAFFLCQEAVIFTLSIISLTWASGLLTSILTQSDKIGAFSLRALADVFETLRLVVLPGRE